MNDTKNVFNQKSKILNLLEKLRSNLITFAVINQQGQQLGYVEDFIIHPSGHLCMVISSKLTSEPRLLQIQKYIQNVDSSNKAVIVNLSQAELASLPVYQKAVPQATNAELEATDEYKEVNDTPDLLAEEVIRLLEEKLVVNRSKKKVGEVVVRKEVETQLVEVPVRREKLIVEKVGSETQQLAEIDLGKGQVTGVETRNVASSKPRYRVRGELNSLKAASDLLEAITLQNQHGCSKVRLELEVDNPELQETYQTMFDRCSKH